MGEERDKNNRDALLCTIPTMKSENLNKTTCDEGGGRWELLGRATQETQRSCLLHLALLESLEERSMGFTLHTVPFAAGASRELFLILLTRAEHAFLA